MPLATGSTLYVSWGNWVPTLCCLILAAAGLGPGARRLSARRNREGQ
jgi:apolipoprotein N-acyltransferase